MKESPKFPDMKHVPWSEEDARRNKYLDTVEGIFTADEEVVMTEKLDGSNSCLTKDKVFARTHSAEPRHESFDYLKKKHREELSQKIPENIAIYGEYLYAKHSIKYTELPGYFVVFAVLNMEEEVWYSWEKTKEIANLHGLPHAPEIKKGHFHKRTFKDEPEGKSEYGDTREGYVLRNTKEIPVGEYVQNAAKCVRHNHVQTEERHWRKGGSIETNDLREDVVKIE